MIVKRPYVGSINRRGQAIAEYLILVALIAVGSIAVVRLLQSNIDRNLAKVSNALGGHQEGPQGLKATESHYKKRDLGNFNDGVGKENEP